MAPLIRDISPAMLLGRVRGRVTAARLTYPERIRVEVTDADGGLWRLATWDAEYSPSDPEALIGKSVVDTSLDDSSGVLTLRFSGGTCFTATPIPVEDDDVENWEFFTPESLVLSYGPKGQWQVGRSDGVQGDPLLRRPRSGVAPVRDSRQWKQACREIGLDDDERELASKDLHAWQSGD